MSEIPQTKIKIKTASNSRQKIRRGLISRVKSCGGWRDVKPGVVVSMIKASVSCDICDGSSLIGDADRTLMFLLGSVRSL